MFLHQGRFPPSTSCRICPSHPAPLCLYDITVPTSRGAAVITCAFWLHYCILISGKEHRPWDRPSRKFVSFGDSHSSCQCLWPMFPQCPSLVQYAATYYFCQMTCHCNLHCVSHHVLFLHTLTLVAASELRIIRSCPFP
jgi:hypothetical protein